MDSGVTMVSVTRGAVTVGVTLFFLKKTDDLFCHRPPKVITLSQRHHSHPLSPSK